ncbi:MAG: hypothetical protein Q4D62_12215 [Planctomycetia bacterium]|nr:hypothetical protein [Planctomycetia bacterium]
MERIDTVVEKYRYSTRLKTDNLRERGWLLDVMNCVNSIPKDTFCLKDIYQYVGKLQEKHPRNHHIKAKIRQQLQELRDRGMIEFIGEGHYQKKFP